MFAVMRDDKGNVVARVQLTYDEAGHLIEERGTRTSDIDALPPELREQLAPEQLEGLANLLSGGDAGVVRTHRYDAAGRRVETRLRFGRISDERTVMTYNEYGDMVESTADEETRELEIDYAGRLCDEPVETKRTSWTGDQVLRLKAIASLLYYVAAMNCCGSMAACLQQKARSRIGWTRRW